ncbi:MAG: HupE/UreJ family protein [Burkholderiales bacterium]|nr:HupE/UreJ family protein [Burkholderiales bacterium]
MRCLLFAMLGLALCRPGPAAAHTTSEAYLTLASRAGSATVTGRLDISLRDLDEVLALDGDGNGEITWGELRESRAAIGAYATARIGVGAAGRPCTPAAGELQVVGHGSGNYAVLALTFECAAPMRELSLDYRLFGDANPMHRGLLKLESGATTRSAVLDPGAPAPQHYVLAEASGWTTLVTYVGQGVWHIWIGIDHILFLVALLLPAVLWRESGRWVAAAAFRGVSWDVLKVVTGFTLAHSITLTLATLGWVTLPSRPVESVIAASVALAAANNLWPVIGARRWMVAFVFGLVHGFGFAGALAELGLPQGALAWSLFGFNVGVELGQLAIVGLFLPVAFALRGTAFYRRAVVTGGSVLIVGVALLWFAERAFGIEGLLG